MRGFMPALAALALAAFTQVPRGVDDPRAFVAEMLGAYARVPNDPPPEPVHVYSERLISLFTVYRVWARAHEDLVGPIDFDWWVNAQDWSIARVSLSQAVGGPARRVVTARWTNYGRTDSSRFVFVRAHGRWMLDDVINGSGAGDDGWTLSELLRERPDPEPGVADPLAFVRGRYALYARGAGEIPALDPIASRRLRAQLDAHDQAAGGEQLINHDWWVAGREGEESRIRGLSLAEEPPRTPGRRTIAARFRNHGRPARLRFGFVREDGAWRLDEVISDEGWTLTGLLAERPR